ncbi:MAG: MlaD family protein [Kofleriaceae bacterium]
MRWLSRLVTTGILLGGVAIAALLIRSRLPDARVGQKFRTSAIFRDGSRLAKGSPVVIAGVRIGDITGLSIEGRFARVDMALVDDIELPVDSFATRRADSLFGDSYIEIIPGSANEGAGTGRLLRSGEPLQHVQEGGSTDTVLRAIARALPKVDNALAVVHEFLVESRQWVNGPFENRLVDADGWLQEGHIEGPLATADRAFERIDELTASAASAVSGSKAEVDRQLARVANAVITARSGIADAKHGVTRVLRDTREGLDRLDPTVAQMAEVIAAIDRGEGDNWQGTLGRLVNDPELGIQIADTTSAISEGVHSFNRFKSWLGARIELGAYSRAFRFYATAEIRARTDKFYLVELEKGSLGSVPADQLSDVAGTSSYVRSETIRDRLRFTAQFGKQFGWIQVRGGIKDSTFGFGGDALLLDGRLRFSADLFGSFQRTPRLKVAAALAVFRSIYVLAGIDDALNEPGYMPIVTGNAGVPNVLDEIRFGRDYFVGAALHFDDADLSTLLRVYGALLIGLL